MVGGFNTNIRYRGRIFHVQTEDSGLENPHIVTLLYEGGAILFSRKSEYGDHAASGADPEVAVRELMEKQHREMVGQLKAGKLDGMLGVDDTARELPGRAPGPAAALSFGEGIVSDRPLDEVVLAHLASS